MIKKNLNKFFSALLVLLSNNWSSHIIIWATDTLSRRVKIKIKINFTDIVLGDTMVVDDLMFKHEYKDKKTGIVHTFNDVELACILAKLSESLAILTSRLEYMNNKHVMPFILATSVVFIGILIRYLILWFNGDKLEAVIEMIGYLILVMLLAYIKYYNKRRHDRDEEI